MLIFASTLVVSLADVTRFLVLIDDVTRLFVLPIDMTSFIIALLDDVKSLFLKQICHRRTFAF